jgi:FKBP-type peptidyl-prolyl cis-trans isomerase SlyD
MNIQNGCVVDLTWTLTDTTGEVIDVLDTPRPFLVGSGDLLPKMSEALQDHTAGDEMELHLEPEHAFGDYLPKLVFFAQRTSLPKTLNDSLEEGTPLQASLFAQGAHGAPADLLNGLSDDAVFRVTELYDEHVVLDGNHPLAGIALRLDLKIHAVRPADPDEVEAGSAQADESPDGWASIMADLAPGTGGPSAGAQTLH